MTGSTILFNLPQKGSHIPILKSVAPFCKALDNRSKYSAQSNTIHRNRYSFRTVGTERHCFYHRTPKQSSNLSKTQMLDRNIPFQCHPRNPIPHKFYLPRRSHQNLNTPSFQKCNPKYLNFFKIISLMTRKIQQIKYRPTRQMTICPTTQPKELQFYSIRTKFNLERASGTYLTWWQSSGTQGSEFDQDWTPDSAIGRARRTRTPPGHRWAWRSPWRGRRR